MLCIVRASFVVLYLQNAADLAEKKGMSITDAVLDETTQETVIQSTNKSVLTRIREKSKYKIVDKVDEDIRSVDDLSLKDINSFADPVAVTKESVFPKSGGFITGVTDVVSRLKTIDLTVYVCILE